MDTFNNYLDKIGNEVHRKKTKDVLQWVMNEFPTLTPKIAWNQPMFTHHDTFIIGFSVSKNHLAIAPERAGIVHFSTQIKGAGFEQSQQLFKFKWNQQFNYELLKEVIEFNIKEKADYKTFWRKENE